MDLVVRSNLYLQEMPPKLIINADDFGMTSSISRAIIDCHKRGNVTSTTMMVSMPGTEDASRLRRSVPSLAVGLHFSLTEGTPLTRGQSLLGPAGRFLPRDALIRRLLSRRVVPEDIRREFVAQLERIGALGVKITHIDSHEHIHMSPAVFEVIAPIVERIGIPMRLVAPPWEIVTAVKSPLKFAKQMALRWTASGFRRRSRLRFNDSLVSIHDLANQTRFDPSDYSRLLSRVHRQQIVELMVHPYPSDESTRELYPDDLQARRPFIAKCEREYEMLSAAPLFQTGHFQLSNYGQI